MCELEKLIGCTLNCDLTSTTLNIYQPDPFKNTTQGFKKDVKSLMTINT